MIMKMSIGKYFLDNVVLPSGMEELRSVTFESYNLTDFLLDIVLIEQIVNPISKKLSENEVLVLSNALNDILLETDLIRKLKLAKKNKFVHEIKDEIRKINDLRNWFSHQRVYYRELSELKDNNKEIKRKIRSFRRIMVTIIDYWIEREPEKPTSEDNFYIRKLNALSKKIKENIKK